MGHFIFARISTSFQFQRVQFNTFSAFAQDAEWSFTGVASSLTAAPLALDVENPKSDSIRGWRYDTSEAFVQDDWKVLPRLTLNLGLRYELGTEPYEVNGKTASLLNPLTDKQVSVVKNLYQNPSRKNSAPRFGFSWDVFGDAKTALQGGAGLFHDLVVTIG